MSNPFGVKKKQLKLARAPPLLPVLRLPGQDPSDASTWVVGVAFVSGNEMHVQVHDGLAGGEAYVDADVVG